MARYVNGRDFRLYVLDAGEYKVVSCLTDCQFSITSNKIQITSRSTGVWSAYDYTNLSWSGSASGVFFIQLVNGGITPFELTAKMINRLKPQIKFLVYDRFGYAKEITGTVVIDQMNYQGGVDDFAVFDLTFTGSGAITITDTIVDCGLIDSDGDLLIDSDGSFLIDGACNAVDIVGEFDPADFADTDFIT